MTMDPTIATVLITVITGVFSVITVKIQKNQSQLIKKIDEQTIFIDKEKALRQKLVQAEKKRDSIIEQMTILSMRINIHLVNALHEVDERIVRDLKQTSVELESSYKEASDTIKDISKEYDLLINMSNEFQKGFDKADKK